LLRVFRVNARRNHRQDPWFLTIEKRIVRSKRESVTQRKRNVPAQILFGAMGCHIERYSTASYLRMMYWMMTYWMMMYL
jgi:hypothetical protein